MLVPFSDLPAATPCSFSLRLSLRPNILPVSSLIDGLIEHPPIHEPIGIDMRPFKGTVIVCTEFDSAVYHLSTLAKYGLCEQHLNLAALMTCMEIILEQCTQSTVFIMGLHHRVCHFYSNIHQQTEWLRHWLCHLRQLAEKTNASIVLLRFCSTYKRSWGGALSTPRHPIQHHRHHKIQIPLCRLSEERH